MRDAWPAIALLAVLGMLAAWRPLPARIAPPPLPCTACQPWMADAIPGIGPKRRDAVAAAVRTGEVPRAAGGWFREAGR